MIDVGDLLDKLDEKRFGKHKPEEILYAVRTLSDAGLINKCVQIGAGGDWVFSNIWDITYAGHEFIESIRDSTTWGKTKEIVKKTGCQAVSFIAQTAGAVVAEAINGII